MVNISARVLSNWEPTPSLKFISTDQWNTKRKFLQPFKNVEVYRPVLPDLTHLNPPMDHQTCQKANPTPLNSFPPNSGAPTL